MNEIRMVFEYYLRRIAYYDFLLRYINTEGFENLKDLISQLKSLSSR